MMASNLPFDGYWMDLSIILIILYLFLLKEISNILRRTSIYAYNILLNSMRIDHKCGSIGGAGMLNVQANPGSAEAQLVLVGF